jgi:hypothetical protein
VGVAGDVLRVVQLNMDSLVSGGWGARRNEIVTCLDEFDADVLCLQEVWQDDRHPSTAGWIAEQAAGDWYWDFGGFPRPGPGSGRSRPFVEVRIGDPQPMDLR